MQHSSISRLLTPHHCTYSWEQCYAWWAYILLQFPCCGIFFLTISLKRYRRHCRMPFLPCDWITAHLPTSLKSPKIVFTFRNDISNMAKTQRSTLLVSHMLIFLREFVFFFLLGNKNGFFSTQQHKKTFLVSC